MVSMREAKVVSFWFAYFLELRYRSVELGLNVIKCTVGLMLRSTSIHMTDNHHVSENTPWNSLHNLENYDRETSTSPRP